MPLTLNVGIARKLGQPGYSSIGASCNLQVELENGLLGDPENLQGKIRQAYLACSKAVQAGTGSPHDTGSDRTCAA